MFTPSSHLQQKVYLVTTFGLAVAGSVILATGSLSTVSLLVGTALLFFSLMLMINISITQSVPPSPRYRQVPNLSTL
jgi:hypothetical protein